jgi:hypothetical protein
MNAKDPARVGRKRPNHDPDVVALLTRRYSPIACGAILGDPKPVSSRMRLHEAREAARRTTGRIEPIV